MATLRDYDLVVVRVLTVVLSLVIDLVNDVFRPVVLTEFGLLFEIISILVLVSARFRRVSV